MRVLHVGCSKYQDLYWGKHFKEDQRWHHKDTKRKLRLSRMDAAIDAMLPYGFAESHVRKVVKLLLKEYGGNEGWPFIEEFSYKELIEAILLDREACDQMTAVEHGNPSQIDSNEENLAGLSGTTAEDNILQGAELLVGLANPMCWEVDRNTRGLGLGRISKQKEREISDAARTNNGEPTAAAPHFGQSSTPDSALSNPSLAPVSRLPTTRRRPCYGWIESDEEDPHDFVYLAPTLESKSNYLFRGLVTGLITARHEEPCNM